MDKSCGLSCEEDIVRQATILLDSQDRIRSLSDGAVHLLGCPYETTVGRLLSDFLICCTPTFEDIPQDTATIAEHGCSSRVFRLVTGRTSEDPLFLTGCAEQLKDGKGDVEGAILRLLPFQNAPRVPEGSGFKDEFLRFLSSTGAAFYFVDAASEEFTTISPGFESLLGYTIEDIRNHGGRKEFLADVIICDMSIPDSGKGRDSLENLKAELWANAGSDASWDRKAQDEAISAFEDMAIEHGEAWWLHKHRRVLRLEEHLMPFVDGGRRVGTIGFLKDVTSLRAKEDVLRRRSLVLHTLMEHSVDGIYAKDLECRKIVANKADAIICGRSSEEEVLGKTDYELFPMDFAVKSYADDLSVLQTGESIVNREERAIDRDGNVRWFLTTKVPLKGTDGKVVGLFGMNHDITRRKRSEEILKESERQLSEIIESFPEPTVVVDRNGCVTHWNRAMELLAGVPSEDVIGRDYLPVFGENRPGLLHLLIDPEKEGSKDYRRYSHLERIDDFISAETVVQKKDGSKVFLFVTATVLRDSKGEISGAIESILDITRRKKAEDERKETDARFRLMSENVVDLIMVFSEEGTCLYASPSYRREGYCAEELLGKNLLDFVHDDDREAVKKAIALVVARHRFQSATFRFKRASGEWRYHEATVSVLVDDSGVRFMAVMRDITDRILQEMERSALEEQVRSRNEELERMLQETNRMREGLVQSEKLASIGQLTAGIAHEINNPLAFVSSNLNRFKEYFEDALSLLDRWHALKDEFADNPSFAARCKEVEEAEGKVDLPFLVEDFATLMKHTRDGADRIKSIVEHLRGFTHLANSGFAEADINDAIEDTIRLTWNELKYKATVVRQLGEIPRVTCNVGEIKQVFVNLIMNAAHALQDKGTITVRTVVADEQVVIKVEDTGVGISQANLNRIFDPFFTTKPVGKGTGLGLWISATIVKKHFGTIHAESREGEGTVMTVALPIVHSQEGVGEAQA